MEDFVTFELAKKLKEKGFKEHCLAHYGNTGGFYSNVIDTYDRPNQELDYIDFLNCFNDGNSIGLIDSPTISQVFKWLREEKEIDIVIYPIDANTVFMGGEKYILSVYINRKRDYKLLHDNINKYVEWKEAALAGIEYVLDNLI